ncbi:DNA mismatch repair protein MSH6-like isoform X2 [Phragmites australis]|uniref:DNA mismatch repair protein MSH6-like isoform X2 n=1 Tax=Phragmites australis TaxID=29695 RepID=UPI002D77E96E|nr:DNA mismatch repair protein MSH6-like isoform X2 [Phragmites australis]
MSSSASRRLSNGRSPLVRKQSQITAFFSSPSPSPSPSGPNHGASKPSPSPLNPSARRRPPLAAASHSPPKPPPPPQEEKKGKKDKKERDAAAAAAPAPSAEVVGRRLRVYWPLDDAWYDGRVEAYDAGSCRHRVKYDDGDEEEVDLGKEKFEWATGEESTPPPRARKLRRLRRMSDTAVAKSPAAADEEDGAGDSTEDENWKTDAVSEDDSEVELDDEEDEDVAARSRKGKSRNSLLMSGSAPSTLDSGLTSASGSTISKRKKVDVGSLDCAKKFSFEAVNATGKVESEVPMNCDPREQTTEKVPTALTREAAERFGQRDAEKFKFLGKARKDAKGRRPGNPGYDPRTLFLSSQFLKSLTGGQRQWWEFKSQHMDKVLFFKMGKFYELFEMDAHVGAKELDLQYMKGEQPHCGFPEKNLSVNLEKLAKKGYRVLVVEQTETPEQLELRRKEMGIKDKVVRREICAVVTKGTLTEGESLLVNPDPSYLLSVTESYQHSSKKSQDACIIGVCIVDVSTSKFIVGQFHDDPERHGLCSILSEMRPVEIIKPAKMLSPETEKALKNNTREPLVNELLPSTEFWDAEKTVHEIKQYYSSAEKSNTVNDEQNSVGCLPNLLSELIGLGDRTHGLSALGGCLFYLRQTLLDEKVLPCAEFEPLACSGLINNIQKHMILDAAALENLEILENLRTGDLSGTLYAQLNHCVTGFGKRLLKRWIARPLYDRRAILQRQSAIATFKGVGHQYAVHFCKDLSRLPDMERLLARLFSSCDENRRSSSVVLYEDASKRLLQQFTTALRGCQQMFQTCSSISMLICTEGSQLNDLLSPGKGLPNVSAILDRFRDAFDWSEADRNGRIIPREGCDPEYDATCNAIEEIESSLKKYLKEQRKLLRHASVNYVNVGKDIYLIEVPESLGGAVPGNYELQSTKKGFYRYWTPEVKELISELSKAEAEKESKLKGILQKLIQLFVEHHSEWRQLVSVVAELDVLISIAIASDYFEGSTCRPTIKESNDLDDTPTFHARNLGHPILRSDSLGKGSFVPNDVKIGGPGNASFIVLTGPNMGGKSTLLRQVCLTIILAQIGADVPAENLELSLVDHIFVRMGARDHIMAGQSTFLVELMETASVLSSATKNSLVALDELGRGTSTSDGQAIAASVLEYLVHHVQCLGLFSTHYHRLAVEHKDTKVSLCHMACEVGVGGGMEEVTFLYRLTLGSCPKSYGVNVARLAGIPASVLQMANEKSSDFEANYGKRHRMTKDKHVSAQSEDKFSAIRDLFRIVKAWHRHGDQAESLSMLCEVQKCAKVQAVED